MGLKLGTSTPPSAPPRSAITRYSERQAALAELPAGAADVLAFFRLVALVFERRRHLLYTVARRRKLEAQLADPALAEHPKRPQAERRLAERWDAERLAVIALAENHAQLATAWDALAAEDKSRYALYTLIGEPDPAMQIDITLWRDDVGLSRLVPFPDDWSVPHDIAHKALDPERHGVTTYDLDELLMTEQPSF